jgi:Helix-turn-helix domain
MIIGETLTQARDRVGLSVTDVSERTRIRETIIRDIEHNEFRSSGGDFYARGHIRAIARVVGADPAPLIEAYDQTHEWSLKQEILRQGILGEDGSLLHPARSAEDVESDDFADAPGSVGFERPGDLWETSELAADPAATTQQVPVYRLGSAPVPSRRREPEVSGHLDQVRPPDQRTMRLPEIHLPAEGIAAFRERFMAGLVACVEALRGTWDRLRALGGTGAEGSGTRKRLRTQGGTIAERSQRAVRDFADWAMALRSREDRRVNVTATLALALLAAIGAIAYLLAASPATPARPASVASSPRASAPKHAASRHPAGHTPAHPAGHSPAGTAVTQAEPLQPAAAIAFGPGGTAQGDNPQLASQALGDKSSQAWHTSWYTTSHFGGLQNGTGLLLDMGKGVTVTSAELTLGIERGANLQLLAGNQPQMADLHPIAGASDAGGGSVVLRPAHPAQARYLLIWFTKLPPNRAGTYEAWISDVAVKGQA